MLQPCVSCHLQNSCCFDTELHTYTWTCLHETRFPSLSVCSFHPLSLYLSTFLCLYPTLSLMISSPSLSLSLILCFPSFPLTLPDTLCDPASLYVPSLFIIFLPLSLSPYSSRSGRKRKNLPVPAAVEQTASCQQGYTTSPYQPPLLVRNTHTHTHLNPLCMHLCTYPCVFSLHVFQRAAFFWAEPDEPP